MLIFHFLLFALLISYRDIKTHRLSKRVTHLALLSLLPFLEGVLAAALILAIANFLLYLSLRALSNGGIGFGDIRLAALIGVYVAAFLGGVRELIWCNTCTWCLSVIPLIYRFFRKRQQMRAPIAFAPLMFLGVAFYLFLPRFLLLGY